MTKKLTVNPCIALRLNNVMRIGRYLNLSVEETRKLASKSIPRALKKRLSIAVDPDSKSVYLIRCQ